MYNKARILRIYTPSGQGKTAFFHSKCVFAYAGTTNERGGNEELRFQDLAYGAGDAFKVAGVERGEADAAGGDGVDAKLDL